MSPDRPAVPAGPPGPPPSPPGRPARPLVTDHVFDRYTFKSTGQTICIHRLGNRLCERPEEEHAHVPEGTEGGS